MSETTAWAGSLAAHVEAKHSSAEKALFCCFEAGMQVGKEEAERQCDDARCLCDHGESVHTEKGCLSSLTGYDHLPCGCPGFEAGNRLIAQVESLISERDAAREALVAIDVEFGTSSRRETDALLARIRALLEPADYERYHARAVLEGK